MDPGRAALGRLIPFVYFGLLALAAAFTGLWLDELHELVGTYNRSFAQMFYWAQYSPGGTPLNFIVQKLVLDAFGFSSFTVRLPAILFAVAALWMFIQVAKEYVGTWWPAAALLFAVLPQIFRYGVEARPYSQGLFLALVAFWCWIRVERHGTTRYVIALSLATAGCLYSQVYSVFPVIGLVAWSLHFPRSRAKVIAAVAAAGLTYIPWFLAQRATQATAHAASYALDWSSLSPLAIIRELCGGGYFTSVPLLLLAGLGFRTTRNWQLLFPAVSALLLPLVADAVLGYFFAGRQLIFALPFLILLATMGIAFSPRWLSVVLLTPLLVASLKSDIRQATTTREDWLTPARNLASHPCVYIHEPDQFPYMQVYEPRLRECDLANLPDEFPYVTTRYSPPSKQPAGYNVVQKQTIGVAEIVTYRRDASLKK